jgi:hypothetical protein
MGFAPLWMTLLVAHPIYLVSWLATESRSNGGTEDSALAVLQVRYISGEINDGGHVTDRVMGDCRLKGVSFSLSRCDWTIGRQACPFVEVRTQVG